MIKVVIQIANFVRKIPSKLMWLFYCIVTIFELLSYWVIETCKYIEIVTTIRENIISYYSKKYKDDEDIRGTLKMISKGNIFNMKILAERLRFGDGIEYNPDMAMYVYALALELHNIHPSKDMCYYTTLELIGDTFQQQEDFKEAITYYELALNAYKKSKYVYECENEEEINHIIQKIRECHFRVV